MDELTNAINNVAHQAANLPPEPELAVFIGRLLADQMTRLQQIRRRDAPQGSGVLVAEDNRSG